eukprot:9173767-Heterocapsa_arctica.AAC.1
MERFPHGRRCRANREQHPVRKRSQGTQRGNDPRSGERPAKRRFHSKAGGQPGRLAMPLRPQSLGAKAGMPSLRPDATKESPG